MGNKRILLIGEVKIDQYVEHEATILGGVMHAANMLSALHIPFSIAAICPTYLHKPFLQASEALGAAQAVIIQNVMSQPNVQVIPACKDITTAYPLTVSLSNEQQYFYMDDVQAVIQSFEPTDVLLFTGQYDVTPLLASINVPMHVSIDAQFDTTAFQLLGPETVHTLILSTSTKLFQQLGNTVEAIKQLPFTQIILKENRGGATLICDGKATYGDAFLTYAVQQSLGEAYSAAWVATESLQQAGFYTSQYAATHDTFAFQQAVSAVEAGAIEQLEGISLPWDMRKDMHIYIAGADFPIKDRTQFELVDAALKFHHFASHRPIIENGVFTGQEPYHEQQAMYNKDLELMEKAALTVAVLTENDPGTLVEIGWMDHKLTPTILYDPYKIAHNLFLKKSVTRIVHTMEELLFETFNILNTKK